MELTYRADLIKDFVIDGLKYHIEFNPENDEIYLYIPKNVIICSASEIEELYPEIKLMEMGLLYPEILKFIYSQKRVKRTSVDSLTQRFIPEPLSVVSDYLYYIAYDRNSDVLYFDIPAREYRTDFITMDTVYPELKYMHQGILVEVVKNYFGRL